MGTKFCVINKSPRSVLKGQETPPQYSVRIRAFIRVTRSQQGTAQHTASLEVLALRPSAEYLKKWCARVRRPPLIIAPDADHTCACLYTHTVARIHFLRELCVSRIEQWSGVTGRAALGRPPAATLATGPAWAAGAVWKSRHLITVTLQCGASVLINTLCLLNCLSYEQTSCSECDGFFNIGLNSMP